MKKFLVAIAIILSTSCSQEQDIKEIDPLVGMWHFTDMACYEDGVKVEKIRSERDYILFEEDHTGFIDSSPIIWERDNMNIKITDQITDEVSWCEIKTLDDSTLILYYIIEYDAYTWERYETYKRIK